MVEINDYYRGFKITDITDQYIKLKKDGITKTLGLNEGGSDD